MKTVKFLLLLTIITTTAFAAGFDGLRNLEPVVVRGGYLSLFYDAPVEQLYLYAYNGETESWNLMPFQIDEKTYGPDPVTGKNRWFYFAPEEWATIDSLDFSDHDGVLGHHDELAFLVDDMGDEAPDHVWIDNAEALSNDERLELIVIDPNDSEKKSYAYMFKSSTILEDVPSPYRLNFNPDGNMVTSTSYNISLSEDNGLITDIQVTPPFGNNVEIFDTQKIRFNGILDFGEIGFFLGKNGSPSANERDNLHLYEGGKYTENPIVRIVREVKQTLRFSIFVIDQAAFYVTTKFYPYSGTIEGGAALDPESLKDALGGEDDILIELDLIRQSFDFNEYAVGMKFYNQYNSGIAIDGVPDILDKTIDIPINEWAMVTGDQGTVFTNVQFKDSSWKTKEMYFYDNMNGGQADSTTIPDGDTGDFKSYGDYGILFKSLPADEDTVNLELGFTAYFLEANQTEAVAQEMDIITNAPVQVRSQGISFPTGVDNRKTANPDVFQLHQNYPNPFNNSTVFSFNLPERGNVTLQIVDINGRIVNTLIDRAFASGFHSINWDGTDAQNNALASGLYFYTLQYNNQKEIRKFSLVR